MAMAYSIISTTMDVKLDTVTEVAILPTISATVSRPDKETTLKATGQNEPVAFSLFVALRSFLIKNPSVMLCIIPVPLHPEHEHRIPDR